MWVTFLLGRVCRGRSVSRLQISTSKLAAPLAPQGPEGVWAKVSRNSGAQACATSFGCWMPGWPCSLGGVGEEPVLCEERGSACPPAWLSPGALRQREQDSDWLPSQIYLGRRQKAVVVEGGEGKICSSWRGSACVTFREHHRAGSYALLMSFCFARDELSLCFSG